MDFRKKMTVYYILLKFHMKQVKFVFAIPEKCQMTALNGYGTDYLQNIIRTATYCQQGCIMRA